MADGVGIGEVRGEDRAGWAGMVVIWNRAEML